MSLIKRTLWAIALALVAGVLVVNSVVSYRNTLHLAAGSAASAQSREALKAIEELQLLVTDAETGQRGYLLTRRDAYLAPYDEAMRAASSHLADLRTLYAGNPAQLDRVVALQPLLIMRLLLKAPK